MGVVFAWILLDELPGPVQLAGGGLVLAGVVAVKLGEQGGLGPAGYRGGRGDDHAFDPTDGLARPEAA
jgi:hypothetical protein